MNEKTCNICGCTEWKDFANRKHICCRNCDSVERTRAMKLWLDYYKIPKPGARILHFAPDQGLANALRRISPDGYEPFDLDPERYAFAAARKFDLTKDCEGLASDTYDLILHAHVLEHVPCNLAYVLYHLSRALTDDGFHVFCIPLMKGHYDEYYGPLDKSESKRRFGQWDHVRNMSIVDVDQHIGKLMRLDKSYSLVEQFGIDILANFNIPPSIWYGLNPGTIFVTRKRDYLLR